MCFIFHYNHHHHHHHRYDVSPTRPDNDRFLGPPVVRVAVRVVVLVFEVATRPQHLDDGLVTIGEDELAHELVEAARRVQTAVAVDDAALLW